MKQLKLTQGLMAFVDDADYDKLSGFRWFVGCTRNSRHKYAVRHVAKKENLGCTKIKMHIQIMGKSEGLQIDHVDGNGLNNCRSNLRFATQAQNMANRRINKNNKSGFKGVSAHGSKFIASIGSGRRGSEYLGTFTTAEMAHKAYLSAASVRYGEFCFSG